MNKKATPEDYLKHGVLPPYKGFTMHTAFQTAFGIQNAWPNFFPIRLEGIAEFDLTAA